MEAADDSADTVDWDKCIICRKDGDLKCPADRAEVDGGALVSYEEFLHNVEGFRQLNSLPVKINGVGLDNADTLQKHRAKWHKSCRLKFAQSKLERTRERQKNKRKDGDREIEDRRSKRQHEEGFIRECIFCRNSQDTLHNCSTMELDESIREMAKQLQDKHILALMAGGDLVAIEAKYHLRCLVAFKNRYRSLKRDHQKEPCNDDTIVQARVFAELVAYIENAVEDGSYIIKLSEVHALYEARLSMLGLQKTVNKTRLKRQLLLHFIADCQEQSDGRNTLIVFNEGLQIKLKAEVASRDFDQEALSMSCVVKSVRQEMMSHDGFDFAGSFNTDCQDESVPPSLKSLVGMLLYGNNIVDQNSASFLPTQACLTICQLIMFNSKQRPTTEPCKPRHTQEREPPLPLYVGLNVHTLTRSKRMLTRLYELGISVSYERILQLEDSMTTALCNRFVAEQSVCPMQMREGLFTVGALDNLDHNLSSTTAQGSFHGTSISLFQFPTITNPGRLRPPVTLTLPDHDSPAPPLPESYRIVPDVACNIKAVTVSEVDIPDATAHHLGEANNAEIRWIQQSSRLLLNDSLQKGEVVAWAAFHAANQPYSHDPVGISSLLPLFFEKAATIQMVRHGMTIVMQATEKLNQGQIPVMAVDQPLFALCKYVQWTWPATFGEDSFVMMLGGLHVEMGLWKMMGDLLQESGWTTALNDAGIASAGTADSFLQASHLTRTRHAHQVTVMSLVKLQIEVWECLGSQQENDTTEEAISKWLKEMCVKSPTFAYWDMVVRLELLVLIFVRSHRERNFALYIEALEALVPWFFVFDRQNYSRWVPVHIRDMKTIPPGIRDELQKHWVFPKTRKRFSAMPLDQAHEQNNAKVKETGGAIGLTENPVALKRWMVSGPEQSRLMTEFEAQYLTENDTDARCHQEGPSVQHSFANQVRKLGSTIKSMGNPFNDTSPELMALDSHKCVDKEAITTLRNMEESGKTRYAAFVKDVLVDRTSSIHEPIKRTNVRIFKSIVKTKSRKKEQLEEIKSDCNLFSQLFVASQVRAGDLDDFFRHENHPWPPSLSQSGKLRLPGSKSRLLDLLPTSQTEDPHHFEVKVFDGPAVVHALHRGESVTFGDYSTNIFIPWTVRQLQNCERIDVVWDVYKEDSLKAATRDKRGEGVRRKVSPETKMPKQFSAFLQNSKNKEELFTLLAEAVSAYEYQHGKDVYITCGSSVISKTVSQAMPPSDQEEADTRMCLHVADAVRKGATTVLVSTVDTDVVVILVGTLRQLLNLQPGVQLWVAFGTGKHYRRYHINSICEQLDEEKCAALPFFHAFTGSDTTSQFSGKAKKSCWEAWETFPPVTDEFAFPLMNPFTPMTAECPSFGVIERFTCILYDRSTKCETVNALRKDLFPRKVQNMQHLPPTQAALLEHVNRSVFQSSIWLASYQTQQNVPAVDAFGWEKRDGIWEPRWTLLDDAATSSRQLIKCGCKVPPHCSRRCVCSSTGLRCTALCLCKGNCVNS